MRLYFYFFRSFPVFFKHTVGFCFSFDLNSLLFRAYTPSLEEVRHLKSHLTYYFDNHHNYILTYLSLDSIMNSNNITFKNSPNQSIIAFSVTSQPRPSTTSSSSDTSTSSRATSTTSSHEPTTTLSSLAQSTTNSVKESSSLSPTPSKTSLSATSTQASSSTAASSSSITSSSSSAKPTSAPPTSSSSLAKPSSTTMPPKTRTPPHQHQGLSHGAIAGIIVACVVAALLLLGLCFCLWYRKRKAQKQRISYHEYSEKATPYYPHRASKNTLNNTKNNINNTYSYEHYNNGSELATSHLDDTTSQYNSITPFSAAAAATAITHNNSTKETFESANNYSNSMLSSPANGGATTPVIDEDFWQNQKPLGTYTIISSYTQTLDDELYIQPGDKVQVYTEYDDGWCLGINLSRGGERGVFPQHCLDRHIIQTDAQYE